MNNTTTVWAKLIPDIVSDSGESFLIETQPTGFSLFNGVGLRLRVALFETDKTTIRDVSDISSLTHFFKLATNTYNIQVLSGPFPNITADDWKNRAAWHAEFAYSDVAMALSPSASYSSTIISNTVDGLAAVDFCCKRGLTVLDSGIPSVFTQPDDSPTLYAALLAAVTAKLGDYAKKVMGPGEMLTFQTLDGTVKRILGVTTDPTLGPQRVDDLEFPP
jgi:hypothetical protein